MINHVYQGQILQSLVVDIGLDSGRFELNRYTVTFVLLVDLVIIFVVALDFFIKFILFLSIFFNLFLDFIWGVFDCVLILDLVWFLDFFCGIFDSVLVFWDLLFYDLIVFRSIFFWDLVDRLAFYWDCVLGHYRNIHLLFILFLLF